MTATHVLRCAKCEGESSGTARDAGKRCACGGAMFLRCKLEPQRPTYRITAREVVSGMLYVLQNRLGQTIQITAVERAGAEVILWRGQSGRGLLLHELVDVQLPGPSPRELACTCGAVENAKACAGHSDGRSLEAARKMACMSPGEHADGCPVAPVQGRHGGVRIWPAPHRGPWQWDRGAHRWESGATTVAPGDLAAAALGWLENGLNDVVLQCFYLPPSPQEERREPTPWAPHAGYEDLAVRYG